MRNWQSTCRADIIHYTDSKWLEFVRQHPEATLFHHSSWCSLIAETYNYKPFIIVLKNSEGALTAGLPVMEVNSWLTGKRWVALPFTDHCCPLMKSEIDIKYFTEQLVLKSKKEKNIKFEIRHKLPAVEANIGNNFFYIHNLKLEKNPDALICKFRKNTVRCIKKASKSGIVVSQRNDLESMMTFYGLHLMTRKKLGVPTQPKRYFLNLWENIINKDKGFIMLAYYQNKAIAGGVFLHFKNTVTYKYGASDPGYSKYCGNHAFFWEAIKWSCRNGFKSFDWGRTDNDHSGLRHFKLGWGTEEKELYYSFIGREPKKHSTGWKQKVVKNIISKSPVLVGRMFGELLYRHVG